MTHNLGGGAVPHESGTPCRRSTMFFLSMLLTLLPRNGQPFQAAEQQQQRRLLRNNRGPFRIQPGGGGVNNNNNKQQQDWKLPLLPASCLYQSSSSSSSSSLQESAGSTQANNRKQHHNNNNYQGTNKKQQQDTTKQLERTIVELGRQGRTDEALAIYARIPHPTVRCMNSAMDACARARPTRLEEAFGLLQSTSGVAPNVFTFGALMSACARARRGDRARALLRSMQKDYGVIPNNVVYSTAIAAVARTNPPQPEVAVALLKEATEKHNIVMNVVGYNAVISACARAGDWKRAASLLSEMDAHTTTNPDHVTYGTVLSACENGKQWDLVLEYANAMEQKGLDFDTLALTSVLKACQQLGLPKEALYYLDVMKTEAKSHPFARKTSGWQRKGAKQPLQGPDAVAYRLAISACARGGAWKDGIRLLEDFEAATGQAPDVTAYTSAITGCEYAGEWKRAFSLLDAMRKKGVEPNEVTMAAVIGACATACAKETGGIAFRETMSSPMPLPQHKALQLLTILKNDDSVVSPNINVYNAAIRVCAEACDLKRSLVLMKDLQTQGLKPTIVTFGTLMTASERVESIEGANSVFRAMRDHEMEPNEIIYGAAISCCRKAGQAERASLLVRKMIKDGLSPNAATFNTAIVAQVEGYPVDKCLDRAIVIYQIMSSRSHKVARPNRQTYNLLIRGLSASKRPVEAHTLLRKMGESGFVPDVDLYAATVAAYERTGQPLQALRLMEAMREDGYDFYEIDVLNSAFKRLVKLVNKVGRGFSSTGEGDAIAPINLDDVVVDEDADEADKR